MKYHKTMELCQINRIYGSFRTFVIHKAAFDLRSVERRVWIRWGQKVDIFGGASAKEYNSVYDNIR